VVSLSFPFVDFYKLIMGIVMRSQSSSFCRYFSE